MNRSKPFGALAGAALLISAAALSGCGVGSSDAIVDSTKTAQNVTDAQIAAIQGNTHMPEDQKQAAIARLKSKPVPTK
jgi:hypothetical protein